MFMIKNTNLTVCIILSGQSMPRIQNSEVSYESLKRSLDMMDSMDSLILLLL